MAGIPEAVFKTVEPMIKQYEGWYPIRYNDGTGVITIGFGFIGSDFPAGMPESMSLTQGDEKLMQLLNESYYPPVAALPVASRMNPNELAATTDAVYNLGSGILEPTHTFGHLLRAGEFAAAAQSLLEYSMPGTAVHAGLLRRRQAELALFDKKWTAPDPNHYLEYPTETLNYGGHSFDERALAESIDGYLEHSHLHHHGLVETLPLARAAKTRIWVVSTRQPPAFQEQREHADWTDHRGSRYQWWSQRVERMEKALA